MYSKICFIQNLAEYLVPVYSFLHQLLHELFFITLIYYYQGEEARN
jgi:hypothetical protein